MTIRSKPYSPEGRDNWDRTFGGLCPKTNEQGWTCLLKKNHEGDCVFRLAVTEKEKPQ